MKHTLSALLVSLGLLVPALASAQELGSRHDVVFSVDRLMGVTGTHTILETRPFVATNDVTSISFGWRTTPGLSPFDLPRFAFDYLVAEHFSIGGSLGYASLDYDNSPDGSAFIVAPRVGYLYSFGRVVGIWPRAGLTYHAITIDGGGGFTDKGFALNLECPFTFSPATHFAFHVGPTFDIDMFGSRKPNGGPDTFDSKYRTIGLNAGLLGWF
jgi:hypothetical protein